MIGRVIIKGKEPLNNCRNEVKTDRMKNNGFLGAGKPPWAKKYEEMKGSLLFSMEYPQLTCLDFVLQNLKSVVLPDSVTNSNERVFSDASDWTLSLYQNQSPILAKVDFPIFQFQKCCHSTKD